MMNAKAKVFISCGQRSGVELNTANNVADWLEKLGFEAYVALEQQSLKGLKENIFAELESSEYFVFIDFPREQLREERMEGMSRGSLFANQELALASYLDLDVMAFQQEGVKKEDGIMRFLQVNCVPFSNAAELPELVAERVKKMGWRSDWKNALALSISRPPFTDAVDQSGVNNRFFHVEVTNVHHRKPALFCTAYVESISKSDTQGPMAHRMVELKWAGSSEQFAVVPPRMSRQVDAGFVRHAAPHVFAFNTFSTSTQYMPPLVGPGSFEVTYLVVSQNFPLGRMTLKVTVGRDIGAARIETM